MDTSISSDRPVTTGLREELEARLATSKVALPMLSESVQRVLSAASDERSDARVLSDLIKRDQALAGHVLRVANSPLYAASTQIVSLQQAVSRLGMQKVREVALMISMQTRVFDVKGYATELKALFAHAVATAVFAQEIARMKRKNVEEAFLAGLLHDVGKPVVLQAIMDSKSPEARAAQRDRGAVWALCDALHGPAGRALAVAWQLPVTLAETIERHHDPASPSSSVHLTRLADDLAHFVLRDAPVEEATIHGHPCAEALNLYPEDLAALLAKGPAIAASAGGLS
jgi:putative nucleotidyltransferase with HDIG domain